MSDESTPLLKQYWELKAQSGDALLFFRMGDFYELFGDDAVEASRILEITLTSRDKNKPNPLPMAGVPWHSAQSYLQRLLKAGKKVAIAEQMEDPTQVKGKTIVRREIVRTFSPGIQFEGEVSEANYLATALPLAHDSKRWTLSLLEVSTGETRVSAPLTETELHEELHRPQIKHFVRVGEQLPVDCAQELRQRKELYFEDIPSNTLTLHQAESLLSQSYDFTSIRELLPQGKAQSADASSAVLGLGVLLHIALKSQRLERMPHLRVPLPLRAPEHLLLGLRTAQHLDLFPSGDGYPNLFDWLNRCKTALGSRELRRQLESPFRATTQIHQRQKAIQEIAQTPGLGSRFQSLFAQIYDLERICGRITTGLAQPRDTLALGRSLEAIHEIQSSLAKAQSPLLRAAHEQLTALAAILPPLARQILAQQKDEAPLLARDGGIFKKGWNPELDRLIDLSEKGEQWLIELEQKEREATGISSLKIRFNRVFGYSIEVTQAHTKNVPLHYVRKQTLTNGERYITEELKKFEDEILNAAAKRKALELELFEALIVTIRLQIPAIMSFAGLIADLDVLVALSELNTQRGFVFPEIDDSLALEIIQGRHPLVDQSLQGGFVPNSTALSPDTRLTLLITGPNMGGKSTVMRQVALMVILGQLGAPVPAERARWGAFTSLFTRIGAHDAIALGQSTFMVEMTELASILHQADERSLIILDEIGRGTSTFDGISVAWSALEWICSQIGARTLFATHYHELTALARTLPRVGNAHMAVETSHSTRHEAEIRFLYELREGPASESFGIHVAKMAGIPAPVIDRAWQILDHLEKQENITPGIRRSRVVTSKPEAPKGSGQLHLF